MSASKTTIAGGVAAFATLAAAFTIPALTPTTSFTLPMEWAACAVLLVLFCGSVGLAISRRPAGLIIDNRNRVSLSKLQAAAWSVLVLSALIAAAFARLRLQEAGADISIPGELLAVMGISATSMVAAPVILSLKSNETPAAGQEAQTAAKLGDDPSSLASTGKVYARSDASAAQWLDLFRGEEVSNASSPDLSKLQQFLITVVVLVVYAAGVWAMFSDPKQLPKALASLPPVSPNLAWLIGISHAGYLAYKAAPHGSSADPSQAPVVAAQDNAVG